MSLTDRDRQRMAGVHSDLVRLVEAASNAGVRFTVIEGVRSLERQKKLFAERKTQTMRSRHLTGHAVDIAPLADTDSDGDTEPSWYWPDYYAMAPKVKAIADEIGVRVEWGGDWSTFKDGPHWQIPWNATPTMVAAAAPPEPATPEPLDMNPERGTLKVGGDNPVEVTLPKMARSWKTGEFWLNVAGTIGTALVLLSPLIDPAMEKIAENPALAAIPGGTVGYALIRMAYKWLRTNAAVKVANAELAR
jgi:peptidoglycan L-alanyl-D-glutamate endopeptidase CwlK